MAGHQRQHGAEAASENERGFTLQETVRERCTAGPTFPVRQRAGPFLNALNVCNSARLFERCSDPVWAIFQTLKWPPQSHGRGHPNIFTDGVKIDGVPL